jgi:predicted alpha-1,2-mannosidase
MRTWASGRKGAHLESFPRRSGSRRKHWRLAHLPVAGVAAVVTLFSFLGIGTTPAAGATTSGASPQGAINSTTTTTEVRNPASLVNPFIGTGDRGNSFPGADLPFGMVQWSPDTALRPDGGGYDYGSRSIIGYSLTHLSGTGCPAEGDVPVLPTVGAIGSNPMATTEPLHHNDESASPGYYQLDAGRIDTQLTATMRSGMALFTFPSSTPVGNLLFKLSDSEASVTSSQFHVVNDTEVDGQVTTGFFCGASNTYTLYFDMVFNHPFSTSGSWSVGGNGAYVSFDTTADPTITAKVGVSYVSDANAVLNRATEDPGWDFNTVKNAALRSWQTMLGKVAVGGGTATQQTVFYTALYHSLLDPSVYSDVNGQYLGMDGQVHTVVAPQTAQYANYSGWDIYRSEIQLLSLLAPQQTSDIVTSMLNDFAQSGQLPKWDEDDTETYIMVGDPADNIIADAYAFGATNFDASQALSDMETEAEVPGNIRPGLSYYESDGYLPVDGTYGCCNFYGPVSTQQEYDIADNSIAELANDLGDRTVAQTFAVRAQNWQNVFNPGTGFMQPKASAGMFALGFSPSSENGFVEADSYIYTALVPFDVAGLVAAEGGDAAWVDFLNGLTSNVVNEGPTEIQMGNEPSFEIPWEYDYAGAPSQTQQVVREIQDELYTDSPTGLAGNDDLGAMSSWYVWSALGAYPETPGSAEVALGSPLFPAITLTLANGRTITETAPAASQNAPYVDGLTLDGSPWQDAYLPSSIFTAGGTLNWTLGSSPSTWASAPADAPPSSTAGLLPALGYLANAKEGEIVVNSGGTAKLKIGVQSMSSTSQQIDWTVSAQSGSGIVVAPSTGTMTVPSEVKVTQSVKVEVPSDLADGQYTVTFALTTQTGVSLPALVAVIDVD